MPALPLRPKSEHDMLRAEARRRIADIKRRATVHLDSNSKLYKLRAKLTREVISVADIEAALEESEETTTPTNGAANP